MQESIFGKLGRDGFDFILLQMDPIEVVKLCWLTNMHLCDKVGWSYLLQKGFRVLPEDIPEDVTEQRLFYYDLATVEWQTLYVSKGSEKFGNFQYRRGTKPFLKALTMPKQMTFRRFENGPVRSEARITYKNDNNPDNMENHYRPSPEGEKVWVMFNPRSKLSFLGQYEDYVDNENVKAKEKICELTACAIMEWEDIGNPLDPDDSDIKQEIYEHLYEDEYYINDMNVGVYQVGEVEFLPIWKN